MRGRQVFFETLLAHGVERIFGNPGTTESPLLDSLLDYPSIKYIVHLHEGVAVGAANFYAQASGKTAFVNLHVAPGLGNAIGMIYGALKHNSAIGAGDGVARAGAGKTLVRLAEKIGAAVWFEGLRGRNAFPTDHFSARGTLGFDAPSVAKQFAGNDLVLMAGGPFFEEVWYAPG